MPPPFNIDNTSPADNALVSAYPNNERASRTLIEEWLSFISDPATGLIRESALPPSGADEIPSGSKMVFFQAAAPTGWTQDVTHNNKAIRIVNGAGAGTGGTTGFTSVFTSRTPAGSIGNTTATGTNASVSVTGTTDNATATGTIGNTTDTGSVGDTALTLSQIPSHNHGATGLTFTGNALPAHAHSQSYSTTDGSQRARGGAGNAGQLSVNIDAVSAGTPSGTIGGSTANAGSGLAHGHSLTMNAHNHSFTGSAHAHTFTSNTHSHTFTGTAHNHTFTGTAMDFAVQYVDMIICTRN